MTRAEDRFKAWPALLLALAARVPALLLSVEHYGDAPVRVEVAERWLLAPHLWRGFAEAYQFGPLHLTLIALALKLAPYRLWAPRVLSCAFGLASVWLLYRVARRAAGPRAALFAACVLALSPLHIQASTSSASEAVFLALFLGALELLLSARATAAAAVAADPACDPQGRGALVASAVLLGLAGLVRYDGWLYVPLFAALLLVDWRRGTFPLIDALWYGALAALPALLWLWQCQLAGDLLGPIHYIDRDHAALAQAGLGWYGALGYRLFCLVYWPWAILVLCTPVAGVLAMLGAARALRRRAPLWELAALAWIPAAYFTFRGAVLADFRPLARFAMVSAALSLPFAWGIVESVGVRFGKLTARSLAALTAAVLVATPAALFALSYGQSTNAAEWARPLSPVSSVPPGIAQAAHYLREHAGPRDVVLLDGVWDYLDIPLAFESGLPESQLVRRSWTDNFEERLLQTPPTMAVIIYQGKLRYSKGSEDAIESNDRFDFRGAPFCRVAQYVYASVYRRC